MFFIANHRNDFTKKFINTSFLALKTIFIKKRENIIFHILITGYLVLGMRIPAITLIRAIIDFPATDRYKNSLQYFPIIGPQFYFKFRPYFKTSSQSFMFPDTYRKRSFAINKSGDIVRIKFFLLNSLLSYRFLQIMISHKRLGMIGTTSSADFLHNVWRRSLAPYLDVSKHRWIIQDLPW